MIKNRPRSVKDDILSIMKTLELDEYAASVGSMSGEKVFVKRRRGTEVVLEACSS